MKEYLSPKEYQLYCLEILKALKEGKLFKLKSGFNMVGNFSPAMQRRIDKFRNRNK